MQAPARSSYDRPVGRPVTRLRSPTALAEQLDVRGERWVLGDALAGRGRFSPDPRRRHLVGISVLFGSSHLSSNNRRRKSGPGDTARPVSITLA